MKQYKKCVAAVDIGGTNIVVGIVDGEGKVCGRLCAPTRSFATPDALVGGIADMTSRLAADTGLAPAACGVGAPCLNACTGCIENATDLPWHGVIPLREMLEKGLEVPVVAVNDANAAAAGEGLAGAARGLADYIVLTLGTGVGAGIVADGHLLRGSRGFAGELGHVRVYDGEGRPCSCGRPDCLQTYASSHGVVETALRLLGASPDTPSALRDTPADRLTARHIGFAAADGDPVALETWRLTGERIGASCAAFAAAFDPDLIVLFGGVAAAFPFMEKSINDSFLRHALFLNAGHIRFCRSALSDADAPIIGAAAMALDTLDA
ncbi:MAG: ROK family protein [Bacteroides sp.]|nr:ROK family protein [Bacteroides sp.]MBD5371546.1 ROK family protein [Bacteroides sp.]